MKYEILQLKDNLLGFGFKQALIHGYVLDNYVVTDEFTTDKDRTQIELREYIRFRNRWYKFFTTDKMFHPLRAGDVLKREDGRMYFIDLYFELIPIDGYYQYRMSYQFQRDREKEEAKLLRKK